MKARNERQAKLVDELLRAVQAETTAAGVGIALHEVPGCIASWIERGQQESENAYDSTVVSNRRLQLELMADQVGRADWLLAVAAM